MSEEAMVVSISFNGTGQVWLNGLLLPCMCTT